MQQTKNYPLNLLPELLDAFKKGYRVSFHFNANGLIRCISSPAKFYDFHEVRIDAIVSCLHIPAILYLMSTVDGLCKGTAIEFIQDHV